MPENVVNPTLKTLRRRTRELAGTTASDLDAAALLLFYAAECGLKALYMNNNSLKSTADETATLQSARSFGHRLDKLIAALKINAQDIPPYPRPLNLRSGTAIQVQHLHEAWRYGEKIQQHTSATEWLSTIVAYVSARL